MANPQWDDTSAVDSAASPDQSVPTWDSTTDLQGSFGTPTQQALTAVEQGLSGATLGLSKVAETGLGITTPQAIAGREAANPTTATTSNIGGTVAGLFGPDEFLAPLKGVQLAGRAVEGAIGAGKIARIAGAATEGAIIGGVNQSTDDWSQDKALDAQKIAASAGIGSLLGGSGAALIEGLSNVSSVKKAVQNLYTRIRGSAAPVDAAATASDGATDSTVPSNIQDIMDRTRNASYSGSSSEMPQKAVLQDVESRIGPKSQFPVHNVQMESLDNAGTRDLYNITKESPGDVAEAFRNYEAVQKEEAVNKVNQIIKDVAPGSEPTADAVKGGQTAIEAFTDQYQNEKEALKPVFQELENAPIKDLDNFNGVIDKLTDAVPGVAEMLDTKGNELVIKPYSTRWGIDRDTYNAVRDAAQSLEEGPTTFKNLWDIRKGLDQNVNVLSQGQGPSEIRALKAAMMDYMQDALEGQSNVDIRNTFKRYAINEQQRQAIEKSFGASVGTPEFGAVSKVDLARIGDKIFKNYPNVQAAKQILAPEQFKTILANWLAENSAAATDNGVFSSNKFGRFLRDNQDSLKAAFSENPSQLQELNDWVTKMRILPDSKPVNPGGTAKTLMHMIRNTNLHDMTWEGFLASIPKKVIGQIGQAADQRELNQILAQKAETSSANQTLVNHVKESTNTIAKKSKAIFTGTSSQARKVHE